MKSKIGIITTELFQVALVTYLILLLLENISPGFVSDFFNMAILLWIVLVSGIFLVLPFSEKKWKSEKKMLEELLHHAFVNWETPVHRKPRWEPLFVFAVSYGGGALVYIKTQDLGNISFVIAAITGIIIWLLSSVILNEEE